MVVVREELLGVVVVHLSGNTVMLGNNVENSANLLGSSLSFSCIEIVSGVHSGHVTERFFSSLVGVLGSLDREVVLGLVTRIETPVSTLRFSLGNLLLLSHRVEVSLPGSSATKVVPVEVTVGREEKTHGPEDPSHFPNHPDISLAHVVGHVEHHFII